MPVSPQHAYPAAAYQQTPGPVPVEAPGERPTVVTVAGFTILATVGLALFAGAMILVSTEKVSDADRGPMLLFGIVHLVIAAGFIAVALAVLRGRNGGRITAFVVYGLAVAFNGCMGFLLVILAGTEENFELPWQGVMFTVVMFLLMLADVLVIVLLAQLPANRWFRAMSQARRAGTLG